LPRELSQVGNVSASEAPKGGRRQRSEESPEFAVEQGNGRLTSIPEVVGVLALIKHIPVAMTMDP